MIFFSGCRMILPDVYLSSWSRRLKDILFINIFKEKTGDSSLRSE
jgi:hypothetical protein